RAPPARPAVAPSRARRGAVRGARTRRASAHYPAQGRGTPAVDGPVAARDRARRGGLAADLHRLRRGVSARALPLAGPRPDRHLPVRMTVSPHRGRTQTRVCTPTAGQVKAVRIGAAVATLVVVVGLIVQAPLGAVTTFPSPSGPVVDAGHLMRPATRGALSRELRDDNRSATAQLAVATVPSTGDEPIEQYAK